MSSKILDSLNDDIKKSQERMDAQLNQAKNVRETKETERKRDEKQQVECMAILEKYNTELQNAGLSKDNFSTMIEKGISPLQLDNSVKSALAEHFKNKDAQKSEQERIKQCRQVFEKMQSQLVDNMIPVSNFEYLINEGAEPRELQGLMDSAMQIAGLKAEDRAKEQQRIQACLLELEASRADLKQAGVSFVELEWKIYKNQMAPEMLRTYISQSLIDSKSK